MMTDTHSTQLTEELTVLRTYATIDGAFRDALRRRLRAQVALARPRARLAWWSAPGVYWGIGSIAVVLLIAVNVMRPAVAPVQVAFDTGQNGAETSDVQSAAPMMLAARKDSASPPMMQLNSPSIVNEGRIPSLFTCDVDDTRPSFEFTDVPEGARSLAIIVDDPDAPSGTLTHWVAYNIDPRIGGLVSESLPEGVVEGETSFGAPGWRGPCPPSGTHRYVFTLYALDTLLPADANATATVLRERMTGHILSEAVLIGTYR